MNNDDVKYSEIHAKKKTQASVTGSRNNQVHENVTKQERYESPSAKALQRETGKVSLIEHKEIEREHRERLL